MFAFWQGKAFILGFAFFSIKLKHVPQLSAPWRPFFSLLSPWVITFPHFGFFSFPSRPRLFFFIFIRSWNRLVGFVYATLVHIYGDWWRRGRFFFFSRLQVRFPPFPFPFFFVLEPFHIRLHFTSITYASRFEYKTILYPVRFFF